MLGENDMIELTSVVVKVECEVYVNVLSEKGDEMTVEADILVVEMSGASKGNVIVVAEVASALI